ncbi:MAG TPA: class I SAM-dependent methyltransferase [Casimicrobiaceae bacterium]
MKQTPLHHNANADILALVPLDARRIIEVGCSSGSLAREYKKLNRQCEYIGIEIDPAYAEAARAWCDQVIVDNIEHLEDDIFVPGCSHRIAGSSRTRSSTSMTHGRCYAGSAVPCRRTPQCWRAFQTWSLQVRLNNGEFRYEDEGLLDRTHIRWFTRTTVVELFRATGFAIVEGGARVTIADEPQRDDALRGIRALAEAVGGDAEAAVENAMAFQWIIRAAPVPDNVP